MSNSIEQTDDFKWQRTVVMDPPLLNWESKSFAANLNINGGTFLKVKSSFNAANSLDSRWSSREMREKRK